MVYQCNIFEVIHTYISGIQWECTHIFHKKSYKVRPIGSYYFAPSQFFPDIYFITSLHCQYWCLGTDIMLGHWDWWVSPIYIWIVAVLNKPCMQSPWGSKNQPVSSACVLKYVNMILYSRRARKLMHYITFFRRLPGTVTRPRPDWSGWTVSGRGRSTTTASCVTSSVSTRPPPRDLPQPITAQR